MLDTKVISILCVNDFHAEIFPTDRVLGSAKLVSVINRFKENNPNTLVVFGGDNYKGDPISDYFSGEPVSCLMKSVGAVASAVGNHEFDYGRNKFKQWQRQGNFTFIAANLLDRSTQAAPDIVKPYLMVCVDGVKIAMIGLATMERLNNANRSTDLHSLEIADGAEMTRKWVDYLNEGNDELGKPDVIIALTHYGLKYGADQVTPVGSEAIMLCRQVPELSGVFTAHWHLFMSLEINHVAVAQGGSFGKGFAVLTIRLSQDHRILNVTPGYFDFSSELNKICPDIEMQNQVEAYYKKALDNELGEVIGVAKTDIVHRSPSGNEVYPEGTPLSQLAIRVLLETTNSQVAMFFSGSIGQGIKKGNITLYMLYKIMFIDSGIVTMKLRGKEIVKNIENGISTLKQEGASPLAFGGLKVTADYAKPFGHRIETICLENGQPLEAERYYDIAVDEYIASNEMGYDFSNGLERIHTGKSIRNEMVQLIKNMGHLEASIPGHFTIKNKTF
ncbi:5'-nucleotidase C-terminal domain-containing protein [Paenibacillus glycanilyticus]|uniref:bifunctional metallophosphatase/5'-nucleotidase n=1 Tax=Paenibacillus glycanilyticus TaxID=126569 RepID=UPI00203D450C|nr:5'-nucleotidase C-terminal domain-containing protein [Paenibacillus glycanilyticus]MCM3626282.1 5'-nucleotidase C-terminal domain-containing protein [Paenibacillus glycanilyticus]